MTGAVFCVGGTSKVPDAGVVIATEFSGAVVGAWLTGSDGAVADICRRRCRRCRRRCRRRRCCVGCVGCSASVRRLCVSAAMCLFGERLSQRGVSLSLSLSPSAGLAGGLLWIAVDCCGSVEVDFGSGS